MSTKLSAMVGLLCAALLLTACGSGLGALEGAWEEVDADDSPVAVEITGDGAITTSADGNACTGTVKPADDVYKFIVDCGFGKSSGTLTLSDDGETLTVGQGEHDPLTLSRAD
ncbi:hypothetical protein [Streptosporangium sp. NPDC000396]|uniref:hypothetical protein n=1 Tax=Streptosporangium sp. NPDC000396 TaxID=3366185 RepID=UPI003697622F